MDRRSLIILLAGAIASMAGFATTWYLRFDRCRDAGGRWAQQARGCVAATGDVVDVARAGDVTAGAVVAVMLAFMLIRVMQYVSGQRPDSRPPSREAR